MKTLEQMMDELVVRCWVYPDLDAQEESFHAAAAMIEDEPRYHGQVSMWRVKIPEHDDAPVIVTMATSPELLPELDGGVEVRLPSSWTDQFKIRRLRRLAEGIEEGRAEDGRWVERNHYGPGVLVNPDGTVRKYEP